MSSLTITPPCIVCNNPSTSRCSKCKMRYFCGRKHQSLDWKRHKLECCLKVMDCDKNDSNTNKSKITNDNPVDVNVNVSDPSPSIITKVNDNISDPSPPSSVIPQVINEISNPQPLPSTNQQTIHQCAYCYKKGINYKSCSK